MSDFFKLWVFRLHCLYVQFCLHEQIFPLWTLGHIINIFHIVILYSECNFKWIVTVVRYIFWNFMNLRDYLMDFLKIFFRDIHGWKMLNQTILLILRVGYQKFNKCQHLSEAKITQNQIYVNITIQLQKSNFKNRIQEYQIIKNF